MGALLFATIIARNYHAQAEVLARSLLRHHSGATLAVLIIDGDEPDRETFAHPSVEVALLGDLPMEPSELHRMLICYNRMEMATAIKPWFLRLLLDRGGDIVCFLDPDIVVYSPFDDILRTAESAEIILTPHALTPFPRDGLFPEELTILRGGVFNLGFIAVGQASRPFLTWWHQRLTTDALFDMTIGLFTDQRWVDFVPVLFKHAICRDPGMNMAHWNLHERGVRRVNGTVVTGSGRPVRFFHFSGFDPASPHRLSRQGFDRPRVRLEDYPDLASMCREYAAELLGANYPAWLAEPYGYDRLPNGLLVPQHVRRRYRDALVAAVDRAVPADPMADNGAALVNWLAGQGITLGYS